jgi:hypothetical protein
MAAQDARISAHWGFGKGRAKPFLAALPVIMASVFLAASTVSAQAAPAPAIRHASVPLPPSITVVPAVTGTFSLINTQSLHDDSPYDQCLGIGSGGGAGNWYCTFTNDQAWDLGRRWGTTGYYELVNKKGQCLGVSGASTAEGARVVGWTCIARHPDQYWGFSAIYSGGVQIGWAVVNLHSGYVLGVAGASPDNGAAVVQWPYQGANALNQDWVECLNC